MSNRGILAKPKSAAKDGHNPSLRRVTGELRVHGRWHAPVVAESRGPGILLGYHIHTGDRNCDLDIEGHGREGAIRPSTAGQHPLKNEGKGFCDVD